jgi:hypothetical protein
MSEETPTLDQYRARLPRKVVKLRRPIPAHEGEVSELTIREPTMEDLERTELTGLLQPMQVLRVVLASCANVPPSSIGSLSVADVLKCQEALSEMGFTVSDIYQLVGISMPITSGASASPASGGSSSGPTGSA